MKKLLYAVMAAATLFSCDNQLEQVNPNVPTLASHWQTQEQAFAGVTAIYNGLITDGAYMRTFPAFSDNRGDDFQGDSPAVYLELGGQFTIPETAGEVQWIWRDHYILVFRSNQVLTYVSEMGEEVLDPDLKNRLLGQAYFLRGLAYYNLAITFKQVPVITELPKDDNDYYPETASEEVLWNQIYSDLSMAQDLLPVSYKNVSGADQGQVGRATKGAAIGLLGKAYVYRQQWEDAKVEFEKLISGDLAGTYSLVANYRDNFSEVNENNSESLFEVQFSTTTGSIWNWTGEPNSNWKQINGLGVSYAMDGKGWADYLPTRWIYNEYKQERTVDGELDPRLLTTIASYEPEANSVLAYGEPWPFATDAIYPRKYTNDGLGASTDLAMEATGGINYRVLRYADILMLYAETLNELGNTAGAYQYIQQVRDRVKLPDLATTKPDMTQEQMRDQIAHERALEFAIEGNRIHDIIRWGWLYKPEKLSLLKEHDSDFNTWVAGKEYLPIPQSELNNNKNLSPNSAN
ncbi:RagB/SusD family nutrient uptake outer membrane protein [Limibacter armeniacum]|uniref:RagB/SusD family nutrient uptake outer membrane protein n=1 Tax=Limibacter armeniacum TaxID=466084 RepID=UPI002FE582C1